MSHSKMTKRGRSHYVESWNPKAKNYVCTCVLCGAMGYKPSIEEDGFASDAEHRAILAELKKVYKPLPLDDLGRCPDCAARQDA